MFGIEQHRAKLADEIICRRKDKGWSQQDLAAKANVSVKTLSKIETNHFDGIKFVTLERICGALGVKVRIMLEGVN